MTLKLNERYPGRFNNPSADYPQGSFKNRTTPTTKDGSYLEQDWANDKEGFFQSLIAAAGITPSGSVDKVGASQLFDALRKLIDRSSPVLGESRNLRMNVTAASATATITADAITVATALGGQAYTIPSFNKIINLATTGAGGMDTGAAPANGWVGIYAIYNPTTGVSAPLGVNSAGSLLPSVYGGANMPAGYTASALISVWGTNASGLLTIGYQRGRKIATALIQVLSGSSLPASYSPIALSSAIPPNAIMVSGLLSLQSTAGSGGISISVAADASGTHRQGINGYTAVGASGAGVVAAFTDLVVATQQLLYFNGLANGPTAYTNIVNTTGYAI